MIDTIINNLGSTISEKETMPMSYLYAAGIVTAVYATHVIHRLFNKSNPPQHHTLYLRGLKQSGGDMLVGNETSNVFSEEYNVMGDLIYPILDCSVLKVVDQNVPLLAQQEKLHAKMHHEGQRERKKLSPNDDNGSFRWSWFVLLSRFLLNKCGRQIAMSLDGFVESTSSIWWYQMNSLPFMRGFFTNEILFHTFEEVEHGPLTTKYLRSQVWTLTPLFTFPLAVAFYILLLLVPPLMCLLHKPSILLKPQTYLDLILYYCTMVYTFITAVICSILYWVLPFHVGDSTVKKSYDYFQNEVNKRGIKYTILKQETYVSDASGVVSKN